MSITVMQPSLTSEMIVQIFNRLVGWEVRKKSNDSVNMRHGQQDGYLMCLIDMLGAGNSEQIEMVTNDEKTCFDIVDRIANDQLVAKVDAVPITDWEHRSNIISVAVAHYIKKNTFEVIESLRFIS